MSCSPFLFSSALPPLSQFTNPMVKSTPRPLVLFCCTEFNRDSKIAATIDIVEILSLLKRYLSQLLGQLLSTKKMAKVTIASPFPLRKNVPPFSTAFENNVPLPPL